MAYLHKKFKKLASVESQEPEPAPPPPQHEGTQLKHSIGSMVAPAPAPELETRDQGGDTRHRKHIRLHADTRAAQHSEAGVVLRPARPTPPPP